MTYNEFGGMLNLAQLSSTIVLSSFVQLLHKDIFSVTRALGTDVLLSKPFLIVSYK